MEREQRVDQRAATRQQAQAHAQFVEGLQMLGELLDTQMLNFALCAGMLADDPKASAQVVAQMMNYGDRYREYGEEVINEAITKESGIKTAVSVPERGMLHLPGYIVAITDKARDTLGRRTFNGVAVVENFLGQQAIVDVEISQIGKVRLYRDELDDRIKRLRAKGKRDDIAERLQKDLGW